MMQISDQIAIIAGLISLVSLLISGFTLWYLRRDYLSRNVPQVSTWLDSSTSTKWSHEITKDVAHGTDLTTYVRNNSADINIIDVNARISVLIRPFLKRREFVFSEQFQRLIEANCEWKSPHWIQRNKSDNLDKRYDIEALLEKEHILRRINHEDSSQFIQYVLLYSKPIFIRYSLEYKIGVHGTKRHKVKHAYMCRPVVELDKSKNPVLLDWQIEAINR